MSLIILVKSSTLVIMSEKKQSKFSEILSQITHDGPLQMKNELKKEVCFLYIFAVFFKSFISIELIIFFIISVCESQNRSQI